MLPYERVLLGLLVASLAGGCDKNPPPSESVKKATVPAPKSVPGEMQLPPGHPPIPGAHAPVQVSPKGGPGAAQPLDPHAVSTAGKPITGTQPTETVLEGITLHIPEKWVYEIAPRNRSMPSMTPKAIFRLPADAPGDASLFVRVTHFPNMKVSDEVNLDRWYGMLIQPDGRPTAEVAVVERFEVGAVQVVMADIPGTIKAVAMGARSAPAKPGQRMLAAILKHEKGPHFVKVQGPAETVGRWKESFVAYLKSAKAN